MIPQTNDWVTLARVVRPQGRRGEVLCDLFTDFPDQFKDRPNVSLLAPSGLRTDAVVQDHWLPVGRSAGRIVLKFAGYDSITDAEKLTKAEAQIPAEERVALDEQTYYVNDLIGCIMTDGEIEIGKVDDMHFPQDPQGRRIETAASIFVVTRANGDEVMIPFANEFIAKIDIAAKRIEMRLPQGLVDMNG
ncbi:16S rRNA processing protein RimM [Terriglobus roseus DSM 18391]|uniref:Ribosome maturation factor RimM n=1 Tax=Terriglobus roseus (strain DSM 18391 / NRRL B-41598 / KBS 63) TaxID=926566 RepID=I3ZHI5_TERRK|nr:ribosome maturation factor RimM [Terriglobus roseus]AFL88360.1 16S rRNA processing protein RimM [Terriglobus roseus DSM 18391]AFL88703.1 16S rRNA processing protein RimM [Terriglobus roseus DSM 18391]